jgi:uncharacterized membrane protein YgdD (TMEM256/DUF423 family)
MTTTLRYAAITLGLAVIFGAFGAHALKDMLTPYGEGVYARASFYHFVHGLALLFLSLAEGAELLSPIFVRRLRRVFLSGILLFCGSLYLLAITDAKWLGMITPLGGVLFIVGWGMLVFRKES